SHLEEVFEVVLGEVDVEVFAAADEAGELRVSLGNPLEDGPARGALSELVEDFGEWNLIGDEQMMEDAEHEDAIEAAIGTGEQTCALAVAPADGRSGTREVGYEGQDGQVVAAGGLKVKLGGADVGVPGDDGCSAFGGDAGVDAGVGSDVENVRGAE